MNIHPTNVITTFQNSTAELNIDAQDFSLINAVKQSKLSGVIAAYKKGGLNVDVNICDYNGYTDTALHWACCLCLLDIV